MARYLTSNLASKFSTMSYSSFMSMYATETDTRSGIDENSLKDYCNNNGYDFSTVTNAINELNIEWHRVGIIKSGLNKGIYIHDHIRDRELEKVYKITPNTSQSTESSSYTYQKTSWWEYDESESIFITIILFPFRLPIMIIIFIYSLIAAIIDFIFYLGWALIATAIGVPIAIAVLVLTLLVGLPLRIIMFIVSFGNLILWEDRLFNWFLSIVEWVLEQWGFY